MVQLAFEVTRLVHLLVQAIVLQHEQNSTLGFLVPVVQINGPNQGLKGIAYHGVMDVLPAHFGPNQMLQPHVFAEQIQVFAVHNAALSLRELALLGLSKIVVEVIGHGHVQHHIAQKLQTFIALQPCLVSIQHGTVGAGLVVHFSLTDTESKLTSHQGGNVGVGTRLGDPIQT